MAVEGVYYRLPPGLKDRVARAAFLAGRSANAEAVARLEASFGALAKPGSRIPVSNSGPRASGFASAPEGLGSGPTVAQDDSGTQGAGDLPEVPTDGPHTTFSSEPFEETP